METNTVAGVEISPEVVETVQSLVVEYSLKVIAALAVLIIGFWIAKQIRKVISKVMERHKVDPVLIGFVTALSHAALKIFVIVAALEALDIKTTSFVAILGAAGLAVGLALQGSLSNFAAGVLMIIFKPFTLNDVVTVNGIVGTVREISILTTMIDAFDNKRIIVPNSKVMADNIINHTINSTRRVDLVAGISYSDDIDKARAAIKAAIAEIPEVLGDPAPDILVSEMADSSVNFAVRPWCNPLDYWKVYFG
ncbi:MAG: mechanosensitive ion channel domain-containing protein, partial [Verrucomicrobiota bacterium]